MVPQKYLLGLTLVFTYHGLLMGVTTAGRKYTLFKTPGSWNEAQDVCVNTNKRMLKIASEAEMKVFRKVLEPWINDGRLTTDMWLGLYDKEPTDPDFVHYWQYDCSPLGKYAPWLTNIEPDGKGKENCVRTTKDGVFKTRPCDSTLAVICQENTDQCWYEEFVDKTISLHNLLTSSETDLKTCKAMCLEAATGTDECVAISHSGKTCNIYTADSIYITTVPTMTDENGYNSLVKRCYDGTYNEHPPTVAENKAKVAENVDCTTTTSTSTSTTTTTPITTTSTTTTATTTAAATTTTTTATKTTTVTSITSTTAASASTTAPTTTTKTTTAAMTAESTTTTPAALATSTSITSTAAATTTETTATTTATTATTPSVATTSTPSASTTSSTSTAAATTTETTSTTTATTATTTSAATTSTPAPSTTSSTSTATTTTANSAQATISTPAATTTSIPATTTVTEVTSTSPHEAAICNISGSRPGPSNTTCSSICLNLAGPNSIEWQQLMQTLLLNRKMLSSYRRAKTSARDDRPSAGTLGASGIGILVLVFGSLILLDMDRFVSMLHRAFKMPRRNTSRTFSLDKSL
ncbi:cell wall protein DAN4-like [Haliotis rufescens]|uniref:cell wall protein DAN4-like n=1 Tax=Haliotis rufescens TaxID=6454 RepID=UPI00201F07FE|nr:cell wall protein DAN4-like [Haliotis rufescens]XP_046380271.2 cell wall protein DAN4-like [Haliotis rufescens]